MGCEVSAVTSGTFATGLNAVSGNASDAMEVPYGVSTAYLRLTGCDANNTVKTQKRQAGAAWIDQTTYNADQADITITVSANEEWRIVGVTQQALKDIKYRMTCLIPNDVAAAPVNLRALFVVSADTGGSGTGSSTGYYTTTATSQRFDGRMQIEMLGTGTPGAIKLAFPAFYVDSVTGYASTVGNSFTIDGASIEFGGVNYPLTFNSGSTSQVMDSSAPMFYTDPITIPGLTLPATLFVRIGAVVATIGQKFPTSRSRFPSNNTVEGISVNGSIQQAGNTGVIIASGGTLSAYLYGPSAVLAAQPSSGAKAFLVYGGDSIAAGSAETDTVGDGHGNIGFVQRALRGAGYNFSTFARGSNQAKFSTSTVVAGSTAATGLYVLAGSVTHGIWQAGTNDINAGSTLANLKSWALNGFAAIKAAGAKVIAIKILPRTTSGNIPITTAFDPVGTHIRQDYNTWLDTQVGVTIDYVYDASPLIENGTTGTWANYATDSIDGTHPNLTCDSTKIAPDFQTFLGTVS